jgi:2,3,4,5-tetrahydropyridine-2-carboxylate N-succinyltransferase
MTPAAYAVGLARHAADGRLLDAWFPRANVGEHPESGAKIRAAAGVENGSATMPIEAAERLLETIHGINADTIAGLLPAVRAGGLSSRTLIVTAIASLEDEPVDAGDVYLRLHLLSMRRIRPHGANLTGIFGLLTNVAWTSAGPVAADELDAARLAAYARGEQLLVHGVDKFPRMVDYVLPTGVRIADADRVRLGAHLAEGTTVMHEGFVNYNAGTLGASMVEGRISAGVVIGDGSDVGGGASIMGTLSGGNATVISVGERCLLGANSGLGISLGDEVTIESGLYLTAGTKVRLPDGAVVSARELSGIGGMLFRRDSQSGAVEALPRAGAGWHGLNAALHAN